MNCEIKSYNYVRAAMFRKKITPLQKLIGLRSTPYSHSEFRFSERYKRISFSATTMDGNNCARFKDIRYSHEAERWDTVIVPMTDEQEDYAYNMATAMNGMPYDIKGQLCHISKWNLWKPNPKKTWCSKAVYQLVAIGREDFRKTVADVISTAEIRPDQLHYLAEYYFRKGSEVL
jgi:hypothetical protein